MFVSLVSGSSGNAALISHGGTTLLADCGMSGKRLEEALSQLDMSCRDIDALLLTHEHTDHTTGAGVISRRYDLPVFATAGTHKNADIGKIAEKNIRLITPGRDFEIGNIGVRAFRVSHDAAEPVGFNFFLGAKKISIATDSGEITEEIYECISGSEEIILESNHDPDLLMVGSYPLELKRRILGKRGHLSNTEAAKTCVRLLRDGTKKILLGHLSLENNTPDIAYRTAENEISQCGAKIGRDVYLSVAKRYSITALA